MTAQLQAQVTASFRPGGGLGEIPLAISGDPGLYTDSNIHLLLTPNVAASVAANVGSVTLGGSKVIDVAGGVITFNDSETATLPYVPTGALPEFATLFAFDSVGLPVSVSVFYDAAGLAVRASRKFTGAVAYTAYQTTARILTYTPLTEPFGKGARTTYGVIAAYYQGALVIHEVQPPNILESNAVIELYAILSYSVTTRDGEFEIPPGYPNTFTYPSSALELDTSLVAKNERVHEVGYINERGFCWVETKNVVIREPYVGVGGYKPVKSKRTATLDPAKYPSDIISKAADFIASRGLGNINA
jgi:hypothetical protein